MLYQKFADCGRLRTRRHVSSWEKKVRSVSLVDAMFLGTAGGVITLLVDYGSVNRTEWG